MNRKTMWTKVFCMVVAVMVFGALNAGAQTVLKFSHTDQQQGARQAAALFFGKKVEEYTNGRYKVQVFCCSQIGNDPKNIEQLALGGIDFTVSSTGSYAPHVDTLNLTMLPFLVETYDQGWKLYDESKWLQAQFDKAPAKGFRFLSTFEAGFRCMTTREPLSTPADAKGKKLRTFPNEMMRWTLEDIGFSVQIMPLPEVYMAIQQGVVSGQENPIDTIYSNKFYEVAPNVTLTQHVYSPIPLAISEKTWQKLSDADRQAVTKAAKEAAVFSRQEIRANDDRQLKEMADKGAKIAKPNLEPFRQAVQPAYAKAREKFGAENVDAIPEGRGSGAQGAACQVIAAITCLHTGKTPAFDEPGVLLQGVFYECATLAGGTPGAARHPVAGRGGRLHAGRDGGGHGRSRLLQRAHAPVPPGHRLDHRAVRVHDGLGHVSGRGLSGAPRGAHDDHRVHRQADREIPPQGGCRRSAAVPGRAGAAGLVRDGHRHGQLGQHSDRSRLAHGVSVSRVARRFGGLPGLCRL